MITCEFNDLTKFSGSYYKGYFVYSSLLVLFVIAFEMFPKIRSKFPTIHGSDNVQLGDLFWHRLYRRSSKANPLE